MGLLISKIYNYFLSKLDQKLCKCKSTNIKIVGGFRTESCYFPFTDNLGKNIIMIILIQ
jgi:hypothetical protein